VTARARRQTVRPNLILAVVCVAQFMVVLDVTIVNIAVPSIHRGLGLPVTGLAWVLDAYALVFGGFMLLGGRAADLFGRKRMFLIGIAVFSLTSLLGGMAHNGVELVTARAMQGLGGAVLSPTTLTLLSVTFTEPRARDRAFGIWGAVGGIGGATGVLVGGLITGLLSWRWIFLINVPVGAVVFAAAVLVVPAGARAASGQVDWLGAVIGTSGLVAVVYGVMRTDRFGWASPQVLGWLALGTALLSAFVVVEHRQPRPLLPPAALRSRELSGANLVMICGSAGTFALFFFLSQYLQDVRGYSPIQAGLAFLPMPIGIIIGTQVAARLIGRVGPRLLLATSSGLSAAGFALLALITPHSSYALHIAVPGMLVTLGSGMSFVPLTMTATNAVPAEDAGLGSGLINTARQVGGSLGLSVLVTVAAAAGAGAGTRVMQQSSTGIATAFAVSAGFLVVAVVAALVVLPRRVRMRTDEAAESPLAAIAPVRVACQPES
jgi:EmrB/QacA subfamily drug resistance transporter